MILERHNRIKSKELFLDETIFTTQNRYLGVRGCFEEGATDLKKTIRGTYINGVYDTHKINYEEKAFGFPSQGESIVNLPDAQSIYVKVGDTILSPSQCEIIDLKREYNLEKGVTKRTITYLTPDGYEFILSYKRLTSLAHKEVFMIDVKISSNNYNGPITIISTLNGYVKNYSDKSDPRLASSHEKKIDILSMFVQSNYGLMTTKTIHTNFNVLTLITHDCDFSYQSDTDQITASKTITLNQNKPFVFKKYALYFNSLDHQDPYKGILELYKSLNDINVYQSHIEQMKAFWNFASIQVEDDKHPNLNQVIHYNLYQLFTSGGGYDRINIPAKGLSGEGYEGHAFWDTEIYMIPFFMQVNPNIAKSLLANRYLQIGKAKQEAKNIGVNQGIKFPWRTISGIETSSYFPAGQAQYHINSDVAYAFIKNYQLNKDRDFFIAFGLPILIETSRFFNEIIVKYNGRYHLHSVTGPDEYTTMVNDNYYTNSMLKYQLDYLVRFLKEYPLETKKILKVFKVKKSEIERFQDIANHIQLNYDDNLKIDVQDDSFLKKRKWNFLETEIQDYPLLTHFHPLSIYRHQVLKQPDTVLSHYLLNNRPYDIMKNSFEYYEALTTHDSSLSKCIHAVQAARLGDLEKSYKYFFDTICMDLDNLQGNTEYGLHVANLGGMYISILNGFIGLEIGDDIKIHPRLPNHMKKLEMNVRMNQTCIMNIMLTHGEININVNQPISLYIYDELVAIKKHYKSTLR